MTRNTLLDFFEDRVRSQSTFLVYDDGYRTYSYTYDDVRVAAMRFSQRLAGAEIHPSDKVIIWGENRPEWVVALWGCLLAGAVVVPIDYRSSTAFADRIREIVGARIVLVGEDVSPSGTEAVRVWALSELLNASPGDVRTRSDGTPPSSVHDTASVRGNDLAEIIFTSGATADPKGVTLTHHNILANIVPVEREVLKYRKYGRPFFPLRFLNLLPLSHMFGQAMATFIPPLLEGVTIFRRGYNPADIVHQIRSRRVSVLVCVPKMLEVLRDHVVQIDPEVLTDVAPGTHVARRWWHYRRVHRLFGFKFWAFVVGAAPLSPDLEAFWVKLGFLVIQGYGLTETAPIVTLNHPFRTRRGTVGTPIGGVQVKIAADGEILVRGENVTSGYFGAPEETAAAFDDGWFHTGDIGVLDESGRLSVQGRKKEMIVTPEGLNVFPEDVERIVAGRPGVRDVAVVGITQGGKERVHAVLVLEAGTDPASVLHDANTSLEEYQRIRSHSIWTTGPLPRTEGTQKLKRQQIKRWVESGNMPSVSPTTSTGALGVVQELVPDRPVTPTTTMAELGLSSIDRIELLMALERAFDVTLDESALTDDVTVADVVSLVETPPRTHPLAFEEQTTTEPRPQTVVSAFPTWNRSPAVRLLRRVALTTFLLPLTRVFAWLTVEGLDRLATSTDPVIYAANHQSHLDAPAILAAMPAGRRHNTATAAAKEFFAGHFHPETHTRRQRFTSSLNYYLSSLFFNVFPLPQREAGTRDAIRYVGELIGDGTSVLIFPEGRRTDDGTIATFQPGIGMLAARLRVPVVPIRLEGLDRVLHPTWRMAKPGRVRVAFGSPLILSGDDYAALAKRVEEAVRML